MDHPETPSSPRLPRDAESAGGDFVFAGTHVRVGTLVDHLLDGGTIGDFIAGYPTVARWQVEALLRRLVPPEPRAVGVMPHPDGVAVTLDDGGTLLVPWHVSTALDAAYPEDRRVVEIIEDGAWLRWPRTGDQIRVAALAGVEAYRRASRAVGADEVHAPATLTPDRATEARGELRCHRCDLPARWWPWGDAWVPACAVHAPENDYA